MDFHPILRHIRETAVVAVDLFTDMMTTDNNVRIFISLSANELTNSTGRLNFFSSKVGNQIKLSPKTCKICNIYNR